MPTYDYSCPNGHRFEVFQRMSDEPVSECAECGAGAERVISGGVGFLFKGDGFYITESRSDDYKKKASADSPSDSPSDSSSGSGDSTKKAAAPKKDAAPPTPSKD
jgi:putative FmdB family regulatory protein